MVLKRNLLSVSIIIALAAAFLSLAIMLGFALLKGSKIQKDTAEKSGTIERFVKKSKMPLTEESISFLADERNKLKSAYSRLKLALHSPLAENIPSEAMDSLQFKDRLIQAQKKLREEAKDFSLNLPESLGFTKYETELSQPAEIPALWRRLAVLEELVYLMTLSGVASLDEINFIGEDLKKETEGEAQPDIATEVPAELPRAGIPPDDKAESAVRQKGEIYNEVKVAFKVTCTYSGLVEFLYKMRVSPFIFVVDDLDVTKGKDTLDKDEKKESMLQASFLVKAEIIR